MGDVVLDDLIDGWLNRPQSPLGLHFPAPLEYRFETDTRAARSHMLMLAGLVLCGLAGCLYPALRDGLPDVADLSRQAYLQTALPMGVAAAALLGLDPPPVLREGLALFAGLACLGAAMLLCAVSRGPVSPLLVPAAIALMVHTTVGTRLHFRFAIGAIVAIFLGVALALHARPDIPAAASRPLLLLVAATGATLLLANWRLEAQSRRLYLLSLRGALRAQALARRTAEPEQPPVRRDPLTGLANRHAYDAWLTATWAQAAANGARLSLIVIDVDYFKSFNDFAGLAAGDACLQKLAVCLREQLRGTTDLLARLGGEEFAVLLPALPEATCADVAERMRLAVQHLELPHPSATGLGLLTISAGVASQVVQAGQHPGHLFDAAEAALYQAKLLGRNRVCVATLGTATGVSTEAA